MERIQKILAAGGIASRRAAEKLITEGRVRVNGRVITELGAKADARDDRIEVDGKRVVAEQHVYLVLHKPRGVVATMSDPEGRPTVRELLAPVGARVYPVGRLDFATSGVLLATNDGDFAEGLLHPKKAVPKTYIVKVNGKMAAEDMDAWRNGVRLEDGMTAPAEAKTLRFEGDKTWFELTIKEGRNQQIRRMGEATGFPVMRLARVSFADITAENIRPGEWRHLTRDELYALKKRYGVPRSIPAPPAAAPVKAYSTRTPRTPHAPRGSRAGSGEGGPRATGGQSAGSGPGARPSNPRARAGTPEGRPAARGGRDARPEPRATGPTARTPGPNTHRKSGRGGTGEGPGGRPDARPGTDTRGSDRATPRGGSDRAAPRGGSDRAAPRGGSDRGRRSSR